MFFEIIRRSKASALVAAVVRRVVVVIAKHPYGCSTGFCALCVFAVWSLLFWLPTTLAYLDERNDNFDIVKAKAVVALISSGTLTPQPDEHSGKLAIPASMRCSSYAYAYVTHFGPECMVVLFPTFDGYRGQGDAGRAFIYISGDVPANGTTVREGKNGVKWLLVNTPMTDHVHLQFYRPVTSKVEPKWYYSRYDGARGLNWVP